VIEGLNTALERRSRSSSTTRGWTCTG
jgi:hypothetical protein